MDTSSRTLWRSTRSSLEFYPNLENLRPGFCQFINPLASFFQVFFFNNVIFVATGLILFDFVKRVYGSEARAFWASFLYAWNPASIFFSSLYTESLYAFLTFTGLWILYGFGFQRLRILSALISFCFLLLSCGLRSNGLANFGYLAFFLLFTGNRNLFLEFKRSFGHIFKILKRLLFNGFILLVLLGITVCATTLVGNEVARRFCETKNPHSPEAIAFAEEHDYVLQGNVGELEWCGRIDDFKPSLFPPFYGHIQKKYWSVEFLGYWKLRKLPCFLLAAPVVLIYVLVSTKGFEGRLRASSSLWRGLLNVVFSTDPFLPMFAHNTIMVLAGLTIFNVEILTRMLFSASPLLYVGLAEIVSNYLKSKASDWTELNWRSWRRSGRLMALLYAYFAVYFVGGTVLHSNWGPFT
ncbi:hypothetical protein L596_024332 [Steinernema carpocapsae]|uniref:GPI mannosyltransferase 2 n=1 Tax=Steinernema carpocapsae TaxID=34508 RepID=A0A4U5MGF4_STECR|nr:hypothetical protein L596_024332 [Steinernema carpocapsae]